MKTRQPRSRELWISKDDPMFRQVVRVVGVRGGVVYYTIKGTDELVMDSPLQRFTRDFQPRGKGNKAR